MGLKRIVIVTGLLLFLFSESCTRYKEDISYKFSRSYVTLYPPASNIFYSKMERVSRNDKNVCGVIIYLSNTFKNPTSYFYTIDHSSPLPAPGKIFVPFNTTLGKAQFAHLEVWGTSGNHTSPQDSMNIMYEPSQIFSSVGKFSYSKDFITVKESNLLFAEKSVNDFISTPPTDEERQFAQKEFGPVISKCSNDRDRVRTLAKYIMTKLKPCWGTPSDSMDALPPFEQYKRTISGKGQIWCGNIALIFSSACLCFDIPMRRIGLGDYYDSKESPVIMNAEGHTTTEIFDRDKQEWYMTDLSFNMLNVYEKGKENAPLNMLEFYYALNNPTTEKKLLVEEFIPKEDKIIRQSITRSSSYKSYKNFFKLNQRFSYALKDGYYNL